LEGWGFGVSRAGLSKKEILRRFAPQDDGQRRGGEEVAIAVTITRLAMRPKKISGW
jgi:hypothetical protein